TKEKIIMCGRYRRTTSEEELARLYHIPIPPQRDLPISWNIAPSQDVLVIRYNPKALRYENSNCYHGWCCLFSLLVATIATLGQTVTVPAGHTTIITQVPAPPGVNTFVRALDNDRYQLIQKRDNKEVYRDTQTGEKWILEIHHRNG